MANIRKRKKKHPRRRRCPCQRKPPLPKTAGPLHCRPWPIPDFFHIRRQFLEAPPKELRRRKRSKDVSDFYGRQCTDVTESMRELVPLHALHPNLVNAPRVDHNRKCTSVTSYLAHYGKPKSGPVITSEVSPYHGNKGTSITSFLRYVPPAHPMAKGVREKADPYYGIRGTDATSGHDRAVPTITSNMVIPKPAKTAASVVYPQHVKPEVLVSAITERRRMYLERQPASSAPSSGRELQPSTDACSVPQSARSEPARSQPKTSSKAAETAQVAATPRSRTEAEEGGVGVSSCSVRAIPPSASSHSTPRSNKPNSNNHTPRPAPSRAHTSEANARQTTRPATTPVAQSTASSAAATAPSVGETARSLGSHRGGSQRDGPHKGWLSARSERSNRSSQDTPASVSTTPQSSRGQQQHNTQELLSKATQRLGPEKFERICNWTGCYEDSKPRSAWR